MPNNAEATDLLAELAAVRAALVNTVSGLTDEQAAVRPTASALCLGGLIKHVTSMEENWIRFGVEGPSAIRTDLPEGVTWADIMSGAAPGPQWMIDHLNEFQMQPGETLAGILDRYAKVGAVTEETILNAPDLSASQPLPEAPWYEPGARHSLRRVLIHVIAETAQHTGHADILRESIDGKTAT
jgi:uncharacterized damage-inducible protein DinB